MSQSFWNSSSNQPATAGSSMRINHSRLPGLYAPALATGKAVPAQFALCSTNVLPSMTTYFWWHTENAYFSDRGRPFQADRGR